MGTRSLTVVRDNFHHESAEEEILVMYVQYDGYPSGHGADLLKFLRGMKVVNGYNSSMGGRLANGMPCLAAQLISNFKGGVGNCYAYPAGTRDCGEEYIYEIYCGPVQKDTGNPPHEFRELHLKVSDTYGEGHVLFDGPVTLRVKASSVVQTGDTCPAQWEAETEDGQYVYVRYRWGTLRIDVAESKEAWLTSSNVVYQERLGLPFDGDITWDSVVEATGLEILDEQKESK